MHPLAAGAGTRYHRRGSNRGITRMAAGVYLEKLTWIEAERWLDDTPVVVIPLGAAAKEHGPHLPLGNDAIIAKWLAEAVRERLPVVVAPLVSASYYPAFVEYPGSISLRADTARDLVVDICRSLARFGASRFYVLNTGISTLGPLAEARAVLGDSIRFEFLNLDDAFAGLPPGLAEQGWGSHADEVETSLMLHIAPAVVDFARAVDDGAVGKGALTRTPCAGIHSPSGVYGQATLASAAKGEVIARTLLDHVLAGIGALEA